MDASRREQSQFLSDMLAILFDFEKGCLKFSE
jgi:hypothetical protein